MPTPTEEFAAALKLHESVFGVELGSDEVAKLQDYYTLLLKWNSRLHLVAPCTPDEFATRHVLESLLALKHLPPDAAVADLGSGAGLPIIPCLIVRPDLGGTFFEASQKKSVFLNEALRVVGRADRTRVANVRFENAAAPAVQFVTCRALDKFEKLLPLMLEWAPKDATYLFFAGNSLKEKIEILLTETRAEKIPQADNRFLVIGRQ